MQGTRTVRPSRRPSINKGIIFVRSSDGYRLSTAQRVLPRDQPALANRREGIACGIASTHVGYSHSLRTMGVHAEKQRRALDTADAVAGRSRSTFNFGAKRLMRSKCRQ